MRRDEKPMRKLLAGEPYRGRTAGSVPMSLSFDRATAEILHTLAPHKKGRSALLSRLLHSFVDRLADRERVIHQLAQELRGETRTIPQRE
jgi:hypothetical protein